MRLHQDLNRRIHNELDELVQRDILTAHQSGRLRERYPTEEWDFLSLVRAFTILGILMATVGLVILVRDHVNWWHVSELVLTLFTASAIVAGRWLKRTRDLPRAGDAVELAGAIALQGLTVVLSMHHSTGSDRWPALVGIDAMLLLVLSYFLANRLILCLACANFFFWFGAETGYVSSWGAYWLGMTYPIRFLAVGLVTLGMSWMHGMSLRGRWVEFSRVYMHFGMLLTHLSLWFLALFGLYDEGSFGSWDGSGSERLLFTLLWAAVSCGSMFASVRLGIQLLHGYGLTFLIINLYTSYFQFVAANTMALGFVHLLVAGGSLLWLGYHLEQKRRLAQA